MLLKTRGTPHYIDAPIIGKVTRNTALKQSNYILIAESQQSIDLVKYKAILTNDALTLDTNVEKPAVYSIGTADHLAEDDIVAIHPDGVITTLYRIQSHYNFLLFTERCNSNCLMCSQPPKDKDDTQYLFDIYRELIPLIPKDCFELGITGGEPTLLGERFFSLLELIKEHLPTTEVHCLTNGRTFAWKNVAQRLAKINFSTLMLGIPLYSDYYATHDYIVQSKDAFNQTIQGLYNLAKFNQRIEIRIVLHKQSIPRLTKLSKFIYKNLPFVEHITFMGLENQGYTPHNIKDLWIDPVQYINELTESVEYLSEMGLNVSIYNLQLCLLPAALWKFTKKSISDWKNIYLGECRKCVKKPECGGLFTSSEKLHSQYIKAFSTTI